MLEFIEEGHIYLYNGVIIPSVSELMQPLTDEKYASIPKKILDKAAERGSNVHKAIEDYENALEVKISDEEKLYFNQYLIFKSKGLMNVVKSEEKFTNGECAGTVDIIGEVEGEKAIIDIKCTAKLNKELLAIQLAFYSMLTAIKNVYVLHLTKENHTFKKIEPNYEVAEALYKVWKYKEMIK